MLRVYNKGLRGCLALALAVGLGLSACQSEEVPDARRNLITTWVDGVMMPQYRDFWSRAGQMQQEVERYCQAPSERSWQALRQKWWELRAPWKRAEVFAFGPYREEPWRIASKVDFWPVRPMSVQKTLGNAPLTTPDEVLVFASAQTGLPAMEYLLYGHSSEEVVANPKYCVYLRGMALDLRQHAQQMLDAWSVDSQNYRARIIDAGRGSPVFSDLDDALTEFVNRIGFTLENIRRDKLAVVLGELGGVSTTGPQPKKAESQFSGRTLEDIRDNLAGIETMIFGGGEPLPPELIEDDLPQSLVQMLAFRLNPMDADLRRHMDATKAAIQAIPEPLERAVKEHPATVRHAIATLAEFQRLVQLQVIPALSLRVTFNDADGD